MYDWLLDFYEIFLDSGYLESGDVNFKVFIDVFVIGFEELVDLNVLNIVLIR